MKFLKTHLSLSLVLFLFFGFIISCDKTEDPTPTVDEDEDPPFTAEVQFCGVDQNDKVGSMEALIDEELFCPTEVSASDMVADGERGFSIMATIGMDKGLIDKGVDTLTVFHFFVPTGPELRAGTFTVGDKVFGTFQRQRYDPETDTHDPISVYEFGTPHSEISSGTVKIEEFKKVDGIEDPNKGIIRGNFELEISPLFIKENPNETPDPEQNIEVTGSFYLVVY